MRRDEQLIKVGSKEIYVHRNILAGGSDYFHAMFSHDTKENTSGVVEMLGVDPECAIICIDHIYGGKVFVPDGKDEEMMHAAVLMQLHTLCDAIASLLEGYLDPKSFFATNKIANTYGCKNLEEKCEEFAEGNFLAISSEEAFGELDKSYIKKIISSKKAKMSEEQKLDALLRWIKHDSERATLCMEMLHTINLQQVPLDFCRHLIEEDSLIFKDYEVLRLFSISALDTMKVTSRKRKLSDIKQPQSETDIVVFDSTSLHLHRFNPQNNSWAQLHEMNENMRKMGFSAVSLDSHIHVLMEDKSIFRLKYPDETATWERMADMIEKHGRRPPAAVLSGYIYVIGGYGGHFSKSIERYSTTLNQWTRLKDKYLQTVGSEVLASHGCIYSLGGYASGECINTVEKFDPASETWSTLTPMNMKKCCVSAVGVDDQIYVLGGYTRRYLHELNAYDIQSNQWTSLHSMIKARDECRAYLIDENICAFGGRKEQDSAEKYNIETNEWTILDLPTNMMIKESVEIKLPQ